MTIEEKRANLLRLIDDLSEEEVREVLTAITFGSLSRPEPAA